jgi:uncharacterized metal-binding protein
LANQLAVALDRSGAAQMSCISGVGGGVATLVKLAQSGRPILALDGCPLACCQACLAQVGVQADQHVLLSELAIRKRHGRDCTVDEQQQAAHAVHTALAKLTGGDLPAVDAGLDGHQANTKC